MIDAVQHLSVIVPVHDGANELGSVLEALVNNDLDRSSWELIVVDDASTDESAAISARYADTVLRLTGRPRGPAYARNRGVELSHGSIIVFVDADVRVRPDALRRVVEWFAGDLSLAAVVGSYDPASESAGVVSQYRNLRHCYLRLRSAGASDFFWPALGAIRREAFLSVGMFDEWHYWRPQVEGAELGQRLRQNGQRIILDPRIRGHHLKHWTLASVVRTDLRDLGIPWMRLLLKEGSVSSSRAPSLSVSEKAGTLLTWALFISGSGLLLTPWKGWLRLSEAALAGVLIVSFPLLVFIYRLRGTVAAIAALPIHLLHYVMAGGSVLLATLLHVTVGEPLRDPVDDAFAETNVKTWPPVPRRRPQLPAGTP